MLFQGGVRRWRSISPPGRHGKITTRYCKSLKAMRPLAPRPAVRESNDVILLELAKPDKLMRDALALELHQEVKLTSGEKVKKLRLVARSWWTTLSMAIQRRAYGGYEADRRVTTLSGPVRDLA